ncbi:MAG: hypothetical protein K6D97_00815 [Clostridia bacterium]|nr:hypothetical protein [Clostridia bacterium]
MAEISDELIEYVKRNQYALAYEFFKNYETPTQKNPKLGGKSIEKLAIEEPRIMEVITDDNLVLIHGGATAGKGEETLSELEQRVRNGRCAFYGPRVENQLFATYESSALTLSHLLKRFPELRERIDFSEYEETKTNPRLTEFIGKVNTLIAAETLYMAQKNGLIDDRALDYLEELYEDNPNNLDNISMHMLNPDILNMNQSFLKRVSRYKNKASELVVIFKTNPEVFKALSKKIDEWENTLSYREATNLERVALRYAALCGAYMNDAKEEDFDDILNYCIRKAQFSTKDLGLYSINFEDSFSKKCDELFENGRPTDKVHAYTTKYLGIALYEAQIEALRKYNQLNLEEIEDEEVREYITRVKEVASIDPYNPEDLKKIEVLYKSNPKVFKPTMSIKAEEMANKAFIKSYEDGFRSTRQKIALPENGETIYYGGTSVRMVKMNGDFSMLIRSTDTGFKTERNLPNDSVKEYEESNPDTRIGLKSCAFVTEDFLGVAPLGENGVYMIYTDVDSSNMGEIGNGDINSNVANYGVRSRLSKSFYKEEIVDNSRQVYSEATVIGNKKPDAIALFDDATYKQRALAIQTAAEYGVDIVYLDKKDIAREQIDRLGKMVEEFKRTGELNLLKKLISKYETNIAGWLLNRDESYPDDSLFTGIDNIRFEETFNDMEMGIYRAIAGYCISEKSKGNKENIEKVYDILSSEKAKYEGINKSPIFPKMKMKFMAEGLMSIINRRFELGHQIETERDERFYRIIGTDFSLARVIDQMLKNDMLGTERVEEGKELVEGLLRREEEAWYGQS